MRKGFGMEDKNTGDLREELMAAPNIDAYLKKHGASFFDKDLTKRLCEARSRKGISKLELARRAFMSEIYVRQVLSGKRRPSRDRLLCLCAALELTADETQEMLKSGSYAPLHPRSRRDAIIEYGIAHQTSLREINDQLYDRDEKALF